MVASTSHNTIGLHGLLQGWLYLLPICYLAYPQGGYVDVLGRLHALITRMARLMGSYTPDRVMYLERWKGMSKVHVGF
jgi:hypothetical protein